MDGQRVGLLLLDLQEALCRPDGEIGGSGFAEQVAELDVLGHAARALAEARRRRMFVAYSRLAFDPDYATLTSASPRLAGLREAGLFQASNPGARICTEVDPAPGELVVAKTGIDPFAGTPLLPAVVSRGLTHLALAGVATEHVVESAARRACDLGIRVTVLADACASRSPELRAHALDSTLPFYATVSTTGEFFSAATAS